MTNLPRIQGMVAYGTPGELAQYFDLNFASVGVSTESRTEYTFRQMDSGGWIRFTSASPVTATIAPFSSVEFQIGVVIMVEQAGTGLVTIAAGAGVTVYGVSSVPGQYSVLRLVNLARNVWSVTDGGGAGSSSSVTLYASRSSAALADIDPTIDAIQTAGYSAAGDGGDAVYYRAGGSTIGGFQSFDGAWWGLAGNVTNDRWTLVGDTNLTIPTTSGQLGDLDTMNRFILNAALTAARTWTLPAANVVPAGWPVVIEDKIGGINNPNILTISRAGADTVNDQTAVVLSEAYDSVALVSDGISKWTTESGWRNRASKTRFWSNIDNGSGVATPRVTTFRERIFAGAAADYVPPLTRGNNTFGWLTSTIGANWAPRDSSLAVISDNGTLAITGMSRTSDKAGISPTPSTWGLGGFVINDASGAFGRSLYLESQRESGAGGTPIIEAIGKNKGSNLTTTPYSLQAGSVDGFWVSAGSDSSYGGSAVNPNDTALVILGNSASDVTITKWNKGIVFHRYSLTGTDGATGAGTAIEMAKGHLVVWRSAAGSGASAVIASAVDTVGQGVQQTFANNGIQLVGADANMFTSTNVAGAVNYLNGTNSVTGVGPSLSAVGTDSDIDMSITPKGTGVLRSTASIKAKIGTAIPAGGTAGAGVMVSSTANFGVFFGSGAPTLNAAKGSLYLRSDGSGTNDRMYVNTNGSTTWTAVVTVA